MRVWREMGLSGVSGAMGDDTGGSHSRAAGILHLRTLWRRVFPPGSAVGDERGME